jgi:hypothetical protein
MKAVFVTAVLALAGSVGFAQAPFNIVRPADGATVRETLNIDVPRASIPSTGYVGVFLNGQFLRAVVPGPDSDPDARFFTISLDTKNLQVGNQRIGDGPLDIRLVLFAEGERGAFAVDESSIQVMVSNAASIPIPENGLLLRYRWTMGRANVYSWDTEILTEAGTGVTGTGASRSMQLQRETEEPIRLMYATDNVFSDGGALIRMQALPLAGQVSANIIASGTQEPRIYQYWEMAPVYMRVTGTGREVWGSLPPFVDGTSFRAVDRVDLLASIPLPVLPTQRVRPGDSWVSVIQQGSLDLTNRLEIESVVNAVVVRAEFIGVEWEQGFPTAKIRHSIDGGTAAQGGRQRLEETFWFALDTGTVIRRELVTTREVRLPDSNGQGQGQAQPGGGGPPSLQPGGDGPRRGLGQDDDQDRRLIRQEGIGGSGAAGRDEPSVGAAGAAGAPGRGQRGSGVRVRTVTQTVKYTFNLER